MSPVSPIFRKIGPLQPQCEFSKFSSIFHEIRCLLFTFIVFIFNTMELSVYIKDLLSLNSSGINPGEPLNRPSGL